MQSLLNLDQYFVEEIVLKVNPQYDEKNKSIASSLSFSVNIRTDSKENPRFFKISMLIDFNKPKRESLHKQPYYGFIKLSGYFSFKKGTEQQIIEKMIVLNGQSILYGVARGVIAQVTANCEHGKFILPVTNFTALYKARSQKSRKRVEK